MNRRGFFKAILAIGVATALPLVSGARSTAKWINVKWFGAIGDGIMDDSAAFKAAFKAATESGRTVYVPRGTYRL